MDLSTIWNFVGAAIIVLVVAWVLRAWLGGAWRRFANGHVTVFEHEAGLKYREGKLVSVLGAGRYATWPAPIDITRLDLREQSTSIAGQEILTADQMSVRLSVVLAYRIADVRAYAAGSASPIARLYQMVQTALRERVAERTLDDILANRGAVVAGMAESIAAEAATLGLAISSVALLDLTLAGPSKQAYADIWKAQKEGIAALERARGEQAALRALANAARMLKGNPELMNLRVLQALAGAPGKNPPTIVLGGAGGLVPLTSNGQVSETVGEAD